MGTIINLLLIAILIVCVWSGYKKGIVMGIGGILAIIVSLYGANLLAGAFSYEVIPALRPFASGFMEQRISGDGGVLHRMGWDDYDYSVADLLERYPDETDKFAAECFESLGIDETSADLMAQAAIKSSDESGAAITDAVVTVLCEKVSFAGCFILAFILILIILTVIGNLPNLSYKIPHMDTLNDIGGAVLGLLTGLMFCFIIVWVLKFAGMIIGEDTLASSFITRTLLKANIVTRYLGF